jgi:hypothetical protein
MKGRALLLAAASVAAAAPGVASAQESEEWKFDAIVYAWLPSVGGKSTFPAGSGSDISVDASQVIDSIKFAFMGTLGAQKGRWGVFGDAIYLDLGTSRSASRNLTVQGIPLPPGVTADVNLDVKTTVWTLAGSYRVVADPQMSFDVLAGARAIDMKQRLRWTFSADIAGVTPPPRTGESHAEESHTDAIVGVRGRYTFGADRQWFVPYYADVGGGDSKLTWQALAGIGYSYRWGDVLGVWRYLSYDFKDKTIQGVNFNGPAIAVAFRW